MEIEKFTEAAIESLDVSKFLSEENETALKRMKDELQDNYEKRQIWRTETEMRVSVLNDVKFPTVASKYWQCVREMGVFFENLTTLSFDYRRNEVKIKRLTQELSDTKLDQFDIEDKEIDLAECYFKRKNMQLAAKDRMREIKLWSQLKSELVEMEKFDTQDVNTHQAITFSQRFHKELQISLNNGVSMSMPEARNLIALKEQSRKELQRQLTIKGDDHDPNRLDT